MRRTIEHAIPVFNERRRVPTKALASAAAVLALGGLIGLPTYVGPSEPTVPATPELPTAEPKLLSIPLRARELLIENLAQPGSPLLTELRDAYHQYGLKAEAFRDCSANPEAEKRIFTHQATEREAPVRIAKAIREIAAGEQFTVPIEVAINSVTGKTPSEVWMGKIEGKKITWAIKEQRYRESLISEYAVDVWPDTASYYCAPFRIEYITQTPSNRTK